MNVSKNYSRWLHGLTKEQFDELVKVFVCIDFNVDLIAITDGKGDGGIDLKILENKRKQQIPIQLTVERNPKTKFKKDIDKIAILVDEKNYQSVIHFFTTEGISEDIEYELTEYAKNNHQIELKLYDCDIIAAYLQKPKYVLLKDKLFQILGDIGTNIESYFDEFDKMKFDLLAYSSETFELKSKFIEAFILHSLFIEKDSKMNLDDLTSKINVKFGDSLNQEFCHRKCQFLETKNRINISNSTPKIVSLTTDTFNELNSIAKEIQIQEIEYLRDIETIISKYSIKDESKNLVDQIYELLKSNYVKDSKEINSDSEQNGDLYSTTNLKRYFKDHLSDLTHIEAVVNDLIEINKTNDFLQKICAGDLFKELINSPEFDAYQRRSSKSIIIDTPVLIYLYRVFIETNYDSKDGKHQIVSHLNSLIKNQNSSLIFLTTDKYLSELSNQIFDAVNLIPSIELGIFDILGGSSNVFYSLYREMVEDGFITDDYISFIINSGINYKGLNENQLKEYIKEFIETVFIDNHIQIQYLKDYSRMPEYKNQFTDIKRELEEIYLQKKSIRNKNAINNDASLLMYFYDEYLEDDEILIDPTLLTWDNSFIEFRKNYHKKHPGKNFWHLFRPSKFLDHHALLTFRIDSEAISNDFISITQGEFDIKEKVQNLNDILNRIIDMRTSEGTKLTTGLAEIRKNYIYKIQNSHEEELTKTELQNHQPIDELMFNMSKHYLYGYSIYSVDQFKNTLKSDDFIESLLGLVNKSLENYLETNNYGYDIQKETDFLLSKYYSTI